MFTIYQLGVWFLPSLSHFAQWPAGWTHTGTLFNSLKPVGRGGRPHNGICWSQRQQWDSRIYQKFEGLSFSRPLTVRDAKYSLKHHSKYLRHLCCWKHFYTQLLATSKNLLSCATYLEGVGRHSHFPLQRGAQGDFKLLTYWGSNFKLHTKTVTIKAGRTPNVYSLNIQCLLTSPGNHWLTFLQT